MNTKANFAGDMTRRGFVAGAAALTAGSVAAGFASTSALADSAAKDGSASSAKSYLDREPLGEPTKTIQADLCICGAGGCGMACAIDATDAGLNVVVLEKMAQAGGSFGFSEVTFAVESHLEKEAGYTHTVTEIVNKCLDYHHYIPSHELYTTFFNNTANTIEWMENLGCEFDGFLFEMGHFYKGDVVKGAGFDIVEHLQKAVEDRGVDIMFETSAKELVMDGGKAAGVLAQDKDGNVIKIEAPAVLLATGGWSNNKDMLRQLGGVDPERVTASGFTGRDGDGIIMAQNAGAVMARGEGTIMFYGPLMPGANWGDQLWGGTEQPTLWVNQDGKRFMNEGMHDLMFLGAAIRDQKRMFVIQSQADIDRWVNEGCWINGGSHVPANQPLDKFQDMLQGEIDAANEYLFVADTIEELADKMGVDAEVFKATVDRYNELVAAGADDDFQKDAAYLAPIEQGPFYAFESFDAFYTTVGGLKVTPQVEVLDANGDPIPGLFAGGCDAGGLYGDCYDLTVAPGSQSSWALNSGRFAAQSAKAYLGK